MILEHEIPVESKLYFGETAKLKRYIENIASDILYNKGFEEIVTPHFSYHQSIDDESKIIRLNDKENFNLTLRADSTIDAVRIINKRLDGNHSKWFYIQPIFRYPSHEQYQIGTEVINEKKVEIVLNGAIDIFSELKIKPLLQLSNINIPMIISKELNIDIEWFKRIEIQKLFSLNIDWLSKLVYAQSKEDLEEIINIVPSYLKNEIQKIIELTSVINYDNIILAPLYYAKMRYYDELFFRFFDGNRVYSRGGRYVNDGQNCVGFGIYTDEVIEILSKGKK